MSTLIRERHGDTWFVVGNYPRYSVDRPLILSGGLLQGLEELDHAQGSPLPLPQRSYRGIPFGRESSSTWDGDYGDNAKTISYILRISYQESSPEDSSSVTVIRADQEEMPRLSKSEGEYFRQRSWPELLVRAQEVLKAPYSTDAEPRFDWEQASQWTARTLERWGEGVQGEIVAQTTATAQQFLDDLDAQLRASFHEEPVEDGVTHAAEDILATALLDNTYFGILDWISQATRETSSPTHSASILRCLGRLNVDLSTTWKAEIIENALRTDDVEIRDAAVQAAERWGDKPLIEILMAHDEPEDWLAEYIDEVISDLSE